MATKFEVKASYQGIVVGHEWQNFTIAKCESNTMMHNAQVNSLH